MRIRAFHPRAPHDQDFLLALSSRHVEAYLIDAPFRGRNGVAMRNAQTMQAIELGMGVGGEESGALYRSKGGDGWMCYWAKHCFLLCRTMAVTCNRFAHWIIVLTCNLDYSGAETCVSIEPAWAVRTEYVALITCSNLCISISFPSVCPAFYPFGLTPRKMHRSCPVTRWGRAIGSSSPLAASVKRPTNWGLQ